MFLRSTPLKSRPAISVEEAACGIADAVEADEIPLRIPIGELARAVLAARHDASDLAPFSVGRIAR
jgi:hypothetical protein